MPTTDQIPIAKSRPTTAKTAVSVGALGVRALSMGALALGAMTLGAFAIGRLSVRKARFGTLEIDRLLIHDLDLSA